MKLLPKLLAVFSVCLLSGFTELFAQTAVAIPGTANIFGAGHAIAPEPGGGGGGTLPTQINLPANTWYVSFPTVAGGIITAIGNGPTSPEGELYGGSYDIYSYGGISGLVHSGRGGFLAGVFLGAAEPADPAPARLTFSEASTGFQSLAPLLAQTFFIGDGLTGDGSGNVQTFSAPAGATRLYLGTLDALGWVGLPGYYVDNGGEFSASVAITLIPEPGTSGLLALGFIFAAILRPRFCKTA